MATVPRASAWGVCLLWVSVNAAAGAGLGAVWSVGQQPGWTSGPVTGALLLGSGLAAGLLQWLVMRRLVPAVGWWVPVSVLGAAAGLAALAAVFGASVGVLGGESGLGLGVAA